MNTDKTRIDKDFPRLYPMKDVTLQYTLLLYCIVILYIMIYILLIILLIAYRLSDKLW
nr:MAG TPA: hypothetical protein [Caudoviricetes sp.]